jgi:hypothetical protein
MTVQAYWLHSDNCCSSVAPFKLERVAACALYVADATVQGSDQLPSTQANTALIQSIFRHRT